MTMNDTQTPIDACVAQGLFVFRLLVREVLPCPTGRTLVPAAIATPQPLCA
jgi:hypothetical protein